MLNSIRFRRPVALAACLLLQSAAWGQNPATAAPPDYGDLTARAAAETARTAWASWQRVDHDLELTVLKASMAEARDRIQRSFSALLNYLDKRKAYSESVANYIEHARPDAAGRTQFVTIETVNREQVGLCGAILDNVRIRLENLRDSPDWNKIHRSVSTDQTEVSKVQHARGAELPIDLPYSKPEAPRQLSSIVYRDSERQIREVLQKLWTDYYQALLDAAEQRPGGSAPLVASITPPSVNAPVVLGPDAAKTPDPVKSSDPKSTAAPPPPVAATSMLVGTWRYVDRSQQFNGVEEPRQILLEIWAEKGGMLAARYRGILSDFDGPHEVDVALHQVPAAKGSKDVTLRYKSAGEDTEGQFTIEGPGASGIDLMVVHTAGKGVPVGREVVVRR